ncbi:MAG TPA: hypothetical protein PLE76_06925 [Rectinema sp.]|nr:hypothetical protein [Rectinema sp.]HOU61610.1 hypothetical protein [Rectinema sp.]
MTKQVPGNYTIRASLEIPSQEVLRRFSLDSPWRYEGRNIDDEEKT